MSGGPSNEPQDSGRKCNKKGKPTRDVSTQCGKWLALKQAIEKDDALRAELLEHIEDSIALLGTPKTPLTPEDERVLIETREALSSHHVADLALMAQPLKMEWDVEQTKGQRTLLDRISCIEDIKVAQL